MKQLCCLLSLLLAGAVTTQLHAQVSFTPQVTNATSNAPWAVVTGDLNGDGIQDLAVANSMSNNISILLGNGDGTFQPQVTYATGSQPQSLVVGDFNGDGIQDLAVANSSSSNIGILSGNGDGTFQPQVTYPVTEPVSIAVSDFNGDGKADLVTADWNNNVSILLGNGDGSFQPQVTYATGGGTSASVAVGDFNGDGKSDIAVTNYNNGSSIVSVLLNNGDGTFQPYVTYAINAGVESGPQSVVTGDFNGDGKPDIAVAVAGYIISDPLSNPTIISELDVLPGNGDGTFQPESTYATGNTPFAVAAGDFNGDGILDLTTADYSDNSISLLVSNGDGTFQPRMTYSTGRAPETIAVSDFNGDGKPDIAIVNTGDKNVSILLNTTTSVTPVTLQGFTGALQHGIATLSWQSGVESNFKQYEVEASTNNKSYAAIGTVAAKGSNHSYTFNTSQTAATASYRLKLADNDGKYRYSDIVVLSQPVDDKINVYPNPAHNTLNISTSAAGTMYVYNAPGQLVKTMQLQAGKNVMDITTLSAGVYYGSINGQRIDFVKK